MAKRKGHNVLHISTFPPRECGIATFAKDLTEALDKKFNPVVKSRVVAINGEGTDMYRYDANVADQICAADIEDYIALANRVNENDDVELVHVQHEFGIFGGENGNHLIPFFQVVKKPVIVTFHTVLPDPTRNLKHAVQYITEHARAAIVMNGLSKEILIGEYEAEPEKIVVIPHGVPHVTFSDGKREKQRLGLAGRTVLSTFGLINRDKGIEYALRALPSITKRFPDVLYLIIGTTHPVVRKREGESYRNFLQQEVKRLDLRDHVKFYDRYLTHQDIASYLKATDIYLSPTLELRQSVSGTLSYALGCGRPVISTPTLYAKHIVTPGRGILVSPKDPGAIAKAIRTLLKDPRLLNRMAQTAYTETRHMIWQNVALAHFDLYRKYASFSPEEKLPSMTLKHLRTLTDDFGIIQFAQHTKPDIRYGYCVDDNARALIVATKSWLDTKNKQASDLIETYLNFIELTQKPNGAFVNFVTAERTINETEISEDAQGRAFWALGYLAAQRTLPSPLRNRTELLLKKSLPVIMRLKSPRAIAFTILGLCFCSQLYPSRYRKPLKKLADAHVQRFLRTARKNWLWFEDGLTYSNSKLSESLLYAYLATGEKTYLEIAERSLRFLMNITFEKDCFSPIGQGGWFFRSGKRTYFDQQPEETSSMVQTLVLAYHVTKREVYKRRALQAFRWFLGKNHLKQLVYDEVSGGCYDGIGRYSLNMNQGAESTISYLLARFAIEELLKSKQ